jgi:enoyl-CoA hydratase/carnithine racemase
MANEVLFEVAANGVATVTLNRPDKLNAINGAVADGIGDAVKRTEADPSIRVIILTTSSERAFSSGADLSAVVSGDAKEMKMYTEEGGFAGFIHVKRRKPWIAAVRGMAVGGGFELCLACDMIVASEDAKFGLPETKRGLLATAGGTTQLPRAIPRNIAIEMILTSDMIDAKRAYELGLVNRVVPTGELMTAARALADRVAANAPLAVQEGLHLVRMNEWHTDEEIRKEVNDALVRLQKTEDFQEGPRAFIAKRPPVWSGR